MADAIRRDDVVKAKAQLDKMRRSLKSWLKYRAINDQVAAGKLSSKLTAGQAKAFLIDDRDWAGEQKLATQLHILLSEVSPGSALPVASIQANPNAAVELATLAIQGIVPASGPQAQGALEWNTWMWPILIVGGLLLAITTAIGSYADVQKEKEHYACIKAGACTDYGLWLKLGALAFAGWFAWEKMGVGDRVTSMVRKR